jgi:hypothetical protein
MVEGLASDLYGSDIDTWSATSIVQGSDKESPVDSHSLQISPSLGVTRVSNNVALVIACLMIDVCACACLVGVVSCFGALSTTSSL